MQCKSPRLPTPYKTISHALAPILVDRHNFEGHETRTIKKKHLDKSRHAKQKIIYMKCDATAGSQAQKNARGFRHALGSGNFPDRNVKFSFSSSCASCLFPLKISLLPLHSSPTHIPLKVSVRPEDSPLPPHQPPVEMLDLTDRRGRLLRGRDRSRSLSSRGPS